MCVYYIYMCVYAYVVCVCANYVYSISLPPGEVGGCGGNPPYNTRQGTCIYKHTHIYVHVMYSYMHTGDKNSMINQPVLN